MQAHCGDQTPAMLCSSCVEENWRSRVSTWIRQHQCSKNHPTAMLCSSCAEGNWPPKVTTGSQQHPCSVAVALCRSGDDRKLTTFFATDKRHFLCSVSDIDHWYQSQRQGSVRGHVVVTQPLTLYHFHRSPIKTVMIQPSAIFIYVCGWHVFDKAFVEVLHEPLQA